MIPANIQDRDCAANLIRKTRRLFPWIAKIFADGGYAGGKLKAALEGQPVKLEVVKRTDNEGGFKVVRRRWVIERTLSWLRRNRRLMAHYEAFAFIAEGFVSSQGEPTPCATREVLSQVLRAKFDGCCTYSLSSSKAFVVFPTSITRPL